MIPKGHTVHVLTGSQYRRKEWPRVPPTKTTAFLSARLDPMSLGAIIIMSLQRHACPENATFARLGVCQKESIVLNRQKHGCTI